MGVYGTRERRTESGGRSNIEVNPNGCVIGAGLDRLGKGVIAVPALRFAARPHALAKHATLLDLAEQRRRQQEVIDLLRRIAKAERALESAVVEISVQER